MAERSASCVDCCTQILAPSRGVIARRCPSCTRAYNRRAAHTYYYTGRRKPPRPCVDCGVLIRAMGSHPRCERCAHRECLTCGKGFRIGKAASHNQRYCSWSCRPLQANAVAHHAERERERSERAVQRSIDQAERVRQRAIEQASREAARQRTCDHCGGTFRAHCPSHRFCSPEHKQTWYHARAKGPVERKCRVCYETFETLNPNARYCDYACMRKARKRAPGEYDRRRRADKIKRLRPTILERWGWRCYLCERPITVGPQETTNPGALTLDHVVPITAGGRDTEDNLRPAHRACNEDKGERYPAWWELRQAGMVA